MKILGFIEAIGSKFRKPVEREEAIEDVGSTKIIATMSDLDIEEAIDSGKRFMELTSMVRFHALYIKRTRMLDHEDPGYKDLEPRSMNYMMEEMERINSEIIIELDLERERRIEKNKNTTR